MPYTNTWAGHYGVEPFETQIYVVQTSTKSLQRCMLMCTDPGDLVLDPTCGSGTTAYVAEQWGRRWITTDTSRVALALARTRLMCGALSVLLAVGFAGRHQERSRTRGYAARRRSNPQSDVKKGFVYKRVPHITLKSIANNEEIDAIHAQVRGATHADPREAERGAEEKLGRVGDPARGGTEMASCGGHASCRMVEAAAGAAERDRRLHRAAGRYGVSLRSALRRLEARAGERAVHGGEPVAASRAEAG